MRNDETALGLFGPSSRRRRHSSVNVEARRQRRPCVAEHGGGLRLCASASSHLDHPGANLHSTSSRSDSKLLAVVRTLYRRLLLC
eukprot:6194797-Pleurochrysis_carterae.AAC.1